MKTLCLINLEDNTIKIDQGHEAKRLIIDFAIDGKKEKKYSCTDLDFGYQLQINNDQIIEESWPIPGIRFAELQPDIVTSADIKLKVDTDYKLLCWFTKDGIRETAMAIFNSGRPFKAYDSMVWNEETEEWDMFKPYPEDDENYYVWNEEKLEWEIFDPEKAV